MTPSTAARSRDRSGSSPGTRCGRTISFNSASKAASIPRFGWRAAPARRSRITSSVSPAGSAGAPTAAPEPLLPMRERPSRLEEGPGSSSFLRVSRIASKTGTRSAIRSGWKSSNSRKESSATPPPAADGGADADPSGEAVEVVPIDLRIRREATDRRRFHRSHQEPECARAFRAGAPAPSSMEEVRWRSTLAGFVMELSGIRSRASLARPAAAHTQACCYPEFPHHEDGPTAYDAVAYRVSRTADPSGPPRDPRNALRLTPAPPAGARPRARCGDGGNLVPWLTR